MKARYALLLSCLLLSLNVMAGSEPLPGSGGSKVSDCNKARDPAQCQARKEARIACQHKRGSDKKLCMDARQVTPQCMADKDRVKCSQKERAAYMCRKQEGKKQEQCIATQEQKFLSRL